MSKEFKEKLDKLFTLPIYKYYQVEEIQTQIIQLFKEVVEIQKGTKEVPETMYELGYDTAKQEILERMEG